MKGLFITGTGTGVGKTFVTGHLLRGLRAAGVDAVSIKPVQTGCAPGEVSPDLKEHWRIAGWRPEALEAGKYAPFCFADPVSPHLAARREGKALSVAEIAVAVAEAAAGHAFLLVEGAGGVLVPLNARETMVDLMLAVGLPVLVVAEAGVGTINHSVLTLRALREAGVAVKGVLLNAREPVEAFIAEDNARTIAQMSETQVFSLNTSGAEGRGTASEVVLEAMLRPMA